ncbi:MAG: hypothetical protein U0350_06550 [Caldilineaceae bacterium]
MNLIPIQVMDEGVLIPRIYLGDTSEFEIVTTSDYILVKPKSQTLPKVEGMNGEQQPPTKARRYRFIGSGRTRNPKASVEAEEILTREINPL